MSSIYTATFPATAQPVNAFSQENHVFLKWVKLSDWHGTDAVGVLIVRQTVSD